MIILNNNNTNVNIPDYDDLVNKPSINGVVLEGNKTSQELKINFDTTNFYTKREVNERIADSITGIENEFGNYYTKTQSDSKYQPKGNYLTSIPSGYATESWVENKGYLTTIPSEYVTESELSGKNYATKSEIPTIPTNISSFNNDSGYITNSALSGYATETYVSDNYQPKGNYLTSVPSEYVTETELQQKDFATNSDVNDEIGKLDSSLSFEIGKKQDELVSGTNIKTINGISLLGSGNIVISGSGEGGSVDLSDYYTKGEVDNLIDNVEVDLTGYATETYVSDNYQPKGNYLTSIPSEYITETELNDAIAGLGGSDVPYVVIENKYATTLTTISGDLQATLNAAKNKQPFLAYFYNTYAVYGKIRTLYPFTHVTVDESGFSLGYHTEVSAVHKDILVNGSYDTTTGEYSLSNLGIITHSYATTTQLDSKQDTLVSGDNIKTINGQSLLGSGDITIEGGTDLTGYATETYVSDNYQPKGNYLTSIPSEYVTESELQGKNYATKSEIPVVPTTISSFTNDSGYITNSALSGYATTTQLNSKQDELVSGTNIKTINGQSLLGSGNINIESETDLSDYYTKGEVDGLISNLDTSVAENYYTILEVDELVESVEPDLTGYATETWVGNHYQTKGNYATTSYVDTQIGNINTILENILN